jgi:hypothetical protein
MFKVDFTKTKFLLEFLPKPNFPYWIFFTENLVTRISFYY